MDSVFSLQPVMCQSQYICQLQSVRSFVDCQDYMAPRLVVGMKLDLYHKRMKDFLGQEAIKEIVAQFSNGHQLNNNNAKICCPVSSYSK